MAGQKVTGLPRQGSPLSTDLLYLVSDPGGTPTSYKVPVSDILGLVPEPADNTIDGYTVAGTVSDDRILRANAGGLVYIADPISDTLTSNNSNASAGPMASSFTALVNMKLTHFTHFITTPTTYRCEFWDGTRVVRTSVTQTHSVAGDADMEHELLDPATLEPSPLIILSGQTYYVRIYTGASVTWRNRGPGTYTSPLGKFQLGRYGGLNSNVTWIMGTATFIEGETALTLDWEDMPTIPADFGDLSDVDMATTAPASGDVPKFDGSNWVPEALPATPTVLDDLSDVDTSAGLSHGESLVYNGTSETFTPKPVVWSEDIPSAGDMFVWGPSGPAAAGTAGDIAFDYYDSRDQRDIPITVKSALWVASITSKGFSHRAYIWQIKDQYGSLIAETHGGSYVSGGDSKTFTFDAPVFLEPGEYRLFMSCNGDTGEWIRSDAPYMYADIDIGTDGQDVYAAFIINYNLHSYGYANGVPAELGSLNDVDMTTTPPVLGDTLQYDGTSWVPVGAAVHTGAKLSASAPMDIVSGVYTTINNIDTVAYDDANFEGDPNAYQLEIPATGRYMFGCEVVHELHATDTSTRVTRIQHGGGGSNTINDLRPFTPTHDNHVVLTGIGDFTAGDYLEIVCMQESGEDLWVQVKSFWIQRIK